PRGPPHHHRRAQRLRRAGVGLGRLHQGLASRWAREHQRGRVMKDPRDIIFEPVVSEKSYGLLDNNVYTFKVHKDASKPEIRDAIQAIFDVKVTSVNTLNRKGKTTRNRRTGVRA